MAGIVRQESEPAGVRLRGEERGGEEIKDKEVGHPITRQSAISLDCHRIQRVTELKCTERLCPAGVKGERIIFRLKYLSSHERVTGQLTGQLCSFETNFPVRELRVESKSGMGGEHHPIAVSMFLLILLPARIFSLRGERTRKKVKTDFCPVFFVRTKF